MKRLVIGPFNRVEGDLEVALDVADGRVRAAYVNSPMYRGFEQILRHKHPMDALVYMPRVCGICSVAQSAASAQALADAMGLRSPENGRLAANLTLACENIADHLSHFYLFFMPDFARDFYRGRPWFGDARARFKSVSGSAAAEVLPARAKFMNLMGYLAGRWPHTLSLQPGGSSRPIEFAEQLRMGILLEEFRAFLERSLFGDKLEAVTSLDSEAALLAWMGARSTAADLPRFLAIAYDLDLHRSGRATDRFMSYGAYPDADANLFPAGVWEDGKLHPLDISTIDEDVSHSWMEGGAALAPSVGYTLPQPGKAGAYSWCKAPRLGGRAVETGALARQLVAGHPLIHDLVARHGGNVTARVVARLLEVARVLPKMAEWARRIRPGEAFCLDAKAPQDASGIGLVEAARGSLGHWLDVRQGMIHNYQIIAPTTWNFSPRDAAGEPGALERALVGAAVEKDHEGAPVAVQHVVRSFDPCMVCTVH
jgi:Ni,Fe-hydrogenase I large subunit